MRRDHHHHSLAALDDAARLDLQCILTEELAACAALVAFHRRAPKARRVKTRVAVIVVPPLAAPPVRNANRPSAATASSSAPVQQVRNQATPVPLPATPPEWITTTDASVLVRDQAAAVALPASRPEATAVTDDSELHFVPPLIETIDLQVVSPLGETLGETPPSPLRKRTRRASEDLAACDAPASHSFHKDGDDRGSARTCGDSVVNGTDGHAMSFHVDGDDRGSARTCGDSVVNGKDGHAMPLKGISKLATLHMPDANGHIETAARQLPAVRTKTYAANGLGADYVDQFVR